VSDPVASASASPGPRWLYLHGFASSPGSTKAQALAAHYAHHGIVLERLDLRKPSFERLRLSAIVAHVAAGIGDEHDRALLIGSSLGGLAACRLAERDARVCAVVLLAPAFALAKRWRRRLGESGYSAWRESDRLETLDHATGAMRHIDFGFVEEIERMDASDAGFPDVRVPTLIVHGVHDETVGIDQSREFARTRRHVRLVEVNDGHELTGSLPRIACEADAFLAGFLNVGPASNVESSPQITNRARYFGLCWGGLRRKANSTWVALRRRV
jgi:pimeloyl-ACP methyl ester carboxylesterase